MSCIASLHELAAKKVDLLRWMCVSSRLPSACETQEAMHFLTHGLDRSLSDRQSTTGMTWAD